MQNFWNSIMYDGAHLWNSAPNGIRSAKPYQVFEKKLLLTFSDYNKILKETCQYIFLIIPIFVT